ncbi:MAG TPA: GntR family transcriptional regulator [Solirubrobacterales bacterium]|nr:GntR family transcriptional regulator [Solirubrobacterales bacterium]HMU25985.1 GntR family transcriptional regulator [Solirubrobacterales bacterium]HMX70831.1 GntR family transcriptional regulator [Solirubrobacterales bacterium]HMY25064.1 GntR family transcriptional regulator [Solirubrobacterales bacterium]HNA24357.1 GntR family transcriptional regulator [Solirubrobacterales bacterium]
MKSIDIGNEEKGSLREIKAESSLTARVRESIREAIIDGSLEPGSLHSVKSLADIFKVSRTPVREALIDLAGADMVEFERNRGVRILETSVHDLEEILVLRILLEVPATYRAAEHIDADGLSALRQELDAMVEAAENGDEPTMMQHDRRFHELINTASGNSRLTEYVDSLRDLILTRGVSTVDNTRSLTEIVDEHEGILTAIASGDGEAAAAAMKEHLVNTASLLLQQEGGRSSSLSLGWERLVAGG